MREKREEKREKKGKKGERRRKGVGLRYERWFFSSFKFFK